MDYFLRFVLCYFSILFCKACPPGRFGISCQNECHCLDGNEVCRSSDGQCTTGVCSIGWTGMPHCQQACPAGTFGYMCRGVCHCPELDTCDAVNGLCDSGECLYGWAGPSCQKRLPVFSCPPNVTVVDATAMRVSWRRWSREYDQGEGPIAYYRLQYMDRGAGGWSTLHVRNEDQVSRQYSLLVNSLAPGHYYSFRLELAMRMEDKVLLSVPGPISEYRRAGAQAVIQPTLASIIESTSSRQVNDITNSLQEINDNATTSSDVIPSPWGLRLIATTPDSLTIQWGSRRNHQFIDKLRITLVESFSAEFAQFERVLTSSTGYVRFMGLQRASLYRCEVYTIQSGTNRSSGSIAAQFWTIQAPLLPPPRPEVLNITAGVAYLRLFSVEGRTQYVSYYEIIVEDVSQSNNGRGLKEMIDMHGTSFSIPDYTAAQAYDSLFYIARRINSENVPPDGVVVSIGDNTTSDGLFNARLQDTSVYAIWVSAVSIIGQVMDRSFIEANVNVQPRSENIDSAAAATLGPGLIALIVISVIIVIILLVALAYYLWLKWPQLTGEQNLEADISGVMNRTRENLQNAFSQIASLRQTLRRASPKKANNKNLQFFTSTPIKRPRKPHKEKFHSSDRLNFADTNVPEIRIPSRLEESTCAVSNSKPILVSYIAEYLQQRAQSGTSIADEFKNLQTGVNEAAIVAKRPENIVRNRTLTTFAFDKNRVKLRTVHPPRSDYINASLVKTHVHRFYIVTQSPMLSTVADFWRIVWERNVDTIAMLLSLTECGDVPYEQYWPNPQQGKCLYNDMVVENVLETRTAYYDLRWLRISEKNVDDTEERSIVHFQYRQWSASGVPHHTIPFLDMLARMREFHVESASIVVHCQGGGGRSGLFVAIDSLLHEARHNKMVDVLKCVNGLRHERPNMVRTFRQYRFIYEALLEALHYRDTRIEASKLQFVFDNLLSISDGTLPSLVATEYEHILSSYRVPGLNSSFKWTDYTTFYTPQKPHTNDRILPHESLLKSNPGRFMVCYMDSHKEQDTFVITHYPNKLSSVVNFWDLVRNEKCPCIVLITDNTVLHTPYWPAQGASMRVDDFEIVTVRTTMDHSETSYLRDIELRKHPSSPRKNGSTKKSQKKGKNVTTGSANDSFQDGVFQQVRQFQFSPWAHAKEAPPLYAMLEFVNEVRKWYYSQCSQQTDLPSPSAPPVVVQSSQGASRGSLFCVLWTLLERLEDEEAVDVYRGVRYARAFTQALCTNVEQYKFLYRALKEHLKQNLCLKPLEADLPTMFHTGEMPSSQHHTGNNSATTTVIPSYNTLYYRSPQALYTIPNQANSPEVSASEYCSDVTGNDATTGNYGMPSNLRAEDPEPIYAEVYDHLPHKELQMKQEVEKNREERKQPLRQIKSNNNTGEQGSPYLTPQNGRDDHRDKQENGKGEANKSHYLMPHRENYDHGTPGNDQKDQTEPGYNQAKGSEKTAAYLPLSSYEIESNSPVVGENKNKALEEPLPEKVTGKQSRNKSVTPKKTKTTKPDKECSKQKKKPPPPAPLHHSTTIHFEGENKNEPPQNKTLPSLSAPTSPNGPAPVSPNNARKLYLTTDQHYAHYKQPDSPNKTPKRWLEIPNILFIDEELANASNTSQDGQLSVCINVHTREKNESDSQNQTVISQINDHTGGSGYMNIPAKPPKLL